MPRPFRIDHEGAWHHVMNRGAARAPVLAADHDCRLFIECLVLATSRYGVSIHGYCLMSTHYHLLLRSKTGRLSSAMRFLSGRFTRMKNLRDQRDGPLFRGRFNSVPIVTDAHLMQVSRYIHLNPIEAGLVDRPEAWPWSSEGAYLGCAERPAWLEMAVISEMVGGTPAAHAYRELLAAGVDDATRDFYAQHT